MCLAHGRGLPTPEPPASPVWAGLAAGGSSGMEDRRLRGGAAVVHGGKYVHGATRAPASLPE